MSRQISVRLDDELDKRLDTELAAVWKDHGGFGPTRSDLLRDLLRSHLEKQEKKRAKGREVS